MVGIVLVALGLAIGLFGLVVQLTNVEPGTVDFTVLGHVVAHPSARLVVLIVTLLVAAGAAIVTLGVVEWRRRTGRHESRSRGPSPETMDWLLQDRIRRLEERLDALYATGTRLGHENEALRSEGRWMTELLARATAGLGELLDLAEGSFVIPDAEPPEEATVSEEAAPSSSNGHSPTARRY